VDTGPLVFCSLIGRSNGLCAQLKNRTRAALVAAACGKPDRSIARAHEMCFLSTEQVRDDRYKPILMM
jgi:hypothetical protein